ncbi:MAG: DUF1295 domain-containing protein [Gammaproteobacteria bacterium]|nr:MAG: DUF1295 domain-containing protein [Gammaproteobacteria bacterium]
MTMYSYFILLLPMFMAGSLFWLISIRKKDVSIVDSLWSLFFIIAAGYFYWQLETPSDRAQLVLLLVLAWGLRLSAYITLRHWGHEEDKRYQVIRANNEPGFAWKSSYLIFGFQAMVAWLISLPLFFAMQSTSALGLLDILAVSLWLIGMAFECIADYQLWRFKRQPANRGKLLTQGLWRYTRHPNYFGEFLIWWGYFLFAFAAGNVWSIVSPLLMSFLLMKFSGVYLLEQSMKSRPGYDRYMQTTNAFFPGWPRGGSS